MFMSGVEITSFGGPEVLKFNNSLSIPTLTNEQSVLIKVVGAGVSRPDCIQRQGLYPAPPGASPLPGLEG